MRHIETSEVRYEGREQITVRAGRRHVERVVPPAGEASAFDLQHWAHRVEVYASPTGRSIRVWLDGVEVKWPDGSADAT